MRGSGGTYLKNYGNCFICGHFEFKEISLSYKQCLRCGHQTWVFSLGPTTLINEFLNEKKIKKMDSKVHFQINLTKEVALNYDQIVDVGCGSGRFLFHLETTFKNKQGVEADSCSRLFAKKILKLDVLESVDLVSFKTADVVSFWHSLEHFSEEQIDACLKKIQSSEQRNLRLIVCLPNTESFHYRIFSEKSVYSDFRHHPHQFSTTSLALLFKKFGFEESSFHISLAYSLAGNALSILNAITGEHNFLYQILNREKRRLNAKIIFHIGLLVLVSPIAFAIFLYELLNPRKGAVLTVVYKRL